jgi:hypothetical protein
MSRNRYLNGCDYLMLAFDHELRRAGYAGNSCQIIVELGATIRPDTLRRRLAESLVQYPLLASRPAGVVWTRWKPCRTVPTVRLHRDDTGLREQLFNDPLDARHGELFRFDLVERDGHAMDLVFTWMHALMDARAAEYFLTGVGRGELPPLATETPTIAASTRTASERWRMAWHATCHIERLARVRSRALRMPVRSLPPRLKYRIEKISADETARVHENAVRVCGVLGQAQFCAAASVIELHHLHQRLGTGSPSYCLPLAVGLRPKSTIEPLFSNQVAMLMIQFLADQLDGLPTIVSALKDQTQQAMRSGLLEQAIMLAEVSRWLPLPLCLAIMKYSLGGEIASLFYGDAGAVNQQFTEFLGAPVVDVAHVAPVTPSPGLGVVFCRFRNQLRFVVVHAAPVLSDTEAAEFAANLRQRLLHP